ncbi:hypothetical protein G0U57_009006, partial [Chelydra serpentina]
MVGDEEHPILYLSQKLLPREQRYTVVKKECLAVKWAMEILRYYLLGRKFTLVTDHAPLQWMHTNKERNARVTRWFLSLQPFHFRIQHRAESQHGNVDSLSRQHCLSSQVAQPHGVEQGRGICDTGGPRSSSR